MTEKQEKTVGSLKDTDAKELDIKLSKYGDLKITYKDQELEVDSPFLSIFLSKINNIRQEYISQLKSILNQLEVPSTGDVRRLTEPTSGNIPKPPSASPKSEKAHVFGECFTCDVKLRSGEGQPCAVCKRTSHKKCIDSGVCGTCLDKAEED